MLRDREKQEEGTGSFGVGVLTLTDGKINEVFLYLRPFKRKINEVVLYYVWSFI